MSTPVDKWHPVKILRSYRSLITIWLYGKFNRCVRHAVFKKNFFALFVVLLQFKSNNFVNVLRYISNAMLFGPNIFTNILVNLLNEFSTYARVMIILKAALSRMPKTYIPGNLIRCTFVFVVAFIFYFILTFVLYMDVWDVVCTFFK